MKILKRSFEKDGGGTVSLLPDEDEDMWHVYNLVSGDSGASPFSSSQSFAHTQTERSSWRRRSHQGAHRAQGSARDRVGRHRQSARSSLSLSPLSLSVCVCGCVGGCVWHACIGWRSRCG